MGLVAGSLGPRRGESADALCVAVAGLVVVLLARSAEPRRRHAYAPVLTA
jgi:hypothetical protein